jgi:TRAP transporter TAXI family solute receptor
VCVLRRGLSLLFCLVLSGVFAGGSALAQGQGAAAWLGLIAGSATASETVLAADLASLFPQNASLRIAPMLGDDGAGNLALLLDDPHVDIAFVSTDALAEAVAAQRDLPDRLELVARLAPQEIHVLARADVADLAGLSGKQVNFGPPSSASAVTAAALFKALGIKVEAMKFEPPSAIEQLKQGAIAAAVIVGGKPSPLVAAIPASSGIHLLPVSFGAELEAAYLPTRLMPEDYPNLIQAGGGIGTVATGMVLLAAKAKSDPASSERVSRFVNAVFPRFAELQAQGRHPKWREVNLAASLPGFARTGAAAAFLHQPSAQPAKPPRAKPSAAKADVSQPATLAENLAQSKEQQESLFKRYIEWQRSKLP